jgi:hypothetical protein
MKIRRFALTAALTAGLATAASAQTNYYANAAAATGDNFNSGQSSKWVVSGGGSNTSASAGNVYHTNGWTIRAGRVGNTTGTGALTFTGGSLVVDEYAPSTSLATGTAQAKGAIVFDLAATLVGPRTNPTAYTSATYTVNLVTAPLTATMTPGVASTANTLRIIQGGNGVTNLNGTLTLNGDTQFKIGSSQTDMRFNINAPITGSGRIEMSGGSAGSQAENGFSTWAVADMSGWTGSLMSVINKHTISFTQDSDFFTTNPTAVINFGTTSGGFLNLSADVSFGSGNVFVNGTALVDGVYTVDDLNLPFSHGASGLYGQTLTNTHIAYFASEGSAYTTSGTTYKLYVGQSLNGAPVPEPSTYAIIFGSLALLGAVVRRRQKK